MALSLISPDIVGKRLELSRLPPWGPASRCCPIRRFSATAIILREAQFRGASVGPHNSPDRVRTLTRLDDQVATMLRLGADALLTPGIASPRHHRRILTFAAARRLPGRVRLHFAEAGCLCRL